MPQAIPAIAAVVVKEALIKAGFNVITAALVALAVQTIVANAVSTIFGLGQASSNMAGILANRFSNLNSQVIVYGTRRVGGQVVQATTTGKNNKNYHQVLNIAAHPVTAIKNLYWGDQKLELTLTGNSFSVPKYTVIKKKVLAPGAVEIESVSTFTGAIFDGTQTSLYPELKTIGFSDTDYGNQMSYIYYKLIYDKEKMTETKPLTVVVEGKKIYDPRTGLTEFSNNPALVVRDYLTEKLGFGASDADIDEASVIAAADICDELVQRQDGSFMKRYTCDAVVNLADQKAGILEQLSNSMAGAVTYSQGKFFIYAGAYTTPTVSLTTDDIVGPINVSTKQSISDTVNTVKGVYLETSQNYVLTNFLPIKNDQYIAEDGGVERVREISLTSTADQERAQRIAKIILEKNRQSITCNFVCNYSALELKVWDTLNLTVDYLGWANKTFRIVGWNLAPQGEGIQLALAEEAPGIYDWNSGDATVGDLAPNTTLPDPFDVSPPGVPLVSSNLYSTTKPGGIKASALVAWNESESGFVLFYQLEYKLTTATNYVVQSIYNGQSAEVFDLEPGTYEFRIKAINTIGASSEYASSFYEIYGLLEPPSDVQNFSVNVIDNNAHLNWNLVPDLDVINGGSYIIKHNKDINSLNWGAGVNVAKVSGKTDHVVVPAMTGNYLIKAEDSSGIVSVNVASVYGVVPEGSNLNLAVLDQEDPNFTGQKTNMAVLSNALQLGGILFDDAVGLFDDSPNDFDYGQNGYALSGEYLFDNYVDLTFVTTARLSANIESNIFGAGFFFDDAQGLFDSRQGLFDGEEVTGVTVKLFIRKTNDDPAGTPTWSNWQEFYVGDYTGRAFEFKIEVESESKDLNVAITELEVSVFMFDRVEVGNLITSAAGFTTINYGNQYFSAPIPNATIIAGVSGDYAIIQNETTTSFDLAVRDSLGAFKSVNTNWISKGY